MEHDRKKNTPFRTSGEVPAQYPWLSEDEYCEVCVIGGGITGALCALRSAEKGRRTVLITSNEIGFGATCCLSCALQGDFGRTLTDLEKIMSTEDSLNLFELGRDSLDELENLCRSLDANEGKCGFKCSFKRRDILLFTDDETDLEMLGHEYPARRHNGFECSYITRDTARDSFLFEMKGGILSKELGATFNPYNFTHLCLMRAAELGVKIYEHTQADEIETPKNVGEGVKIITSAGRMVHADKIILATGSDGVSALLPNSRRRVSYSTVSRQIPPESESGWPGKCIIKGFMHPHFTFSFTPGERILSTLPECRELRSEGRLRSLLNLRNASENKFDRLEDERNYMFPSTAAVKTAYMYECEHIMTPDGLPLIGEHPNYPDCIFALCTGESEALYSQAAARLVADILECESSCQSIAAELFDPKRFSNKK